MTLTEIMIEAAALNPVEQKELAAFLAVLIMKQSSEWDEAVTNRETPDCRGWIPLGDAKRQLS
jgi:hypothetical protein